MAGYWPSSFFYVFMDRAILTEEQAILKRISYAAFFCGKQRVASPEQAR